MTSSLRLRLLARQAAQAVGQVARDVDAVDRAALREALLHLAVDADEVPPRAGERRPRRLEHPGVVRDHRRAVARGAEQLGQCRLRAGDVLPAVDARRVGVRVPAVRRERADPRVDAASRRAGGQLLGARVREAQRLARERVERRRGDLVARAVAIGAIGADVVGAHAVEAHDHDAHPPLGDGRAGRRGGPDRLGAAVVAQERERPRRRGPRRHPVRRPARKPRREIGALTGGQHRRRVGSCRDRVRACAGRPPSSWSS